MYVQVPQVLAASACTLTVRQCPAVSILSLPSTMLILRCRVVASAYKTAATASRLNPTTPTAWRQARGRTTPSCQVGVAHLGDLFWPSLQHLTVAIAAYAPSATVLKRGALPRQPLCAAREGRGSARSLGLRLQQTCVVGDQPLCLYRCHSHV